MPRLMVITARTEQITYEIDAHDIADATARYLMDGDEVGSRTTATSVIDVQEVTDTSAEHVNAQRHTP